MGYKFGGVGLCVLLASLFIPASVYTGEGAIRWEDRVLPLPKELSVADSMTVRAGDISYRIYTDGDAPVFSTIDSLLGSFAVGESGGLAEVKISVLLLGESPGGVPAAMESRLRGLPNAGQAYAVFFSRHTAEAPLELTLAANTPEGLLYAAHTLTQLVKPGDNVDSGTLLEIPLVNIVDWPDIKLRGEWGASGYVGWGWYSQWKLNMYKVSTRSGFASPGDELPEFSLGPLSQDRGRNFPGWAEELGYTLIPYVGHVGHWADGNWRGVSLRVVDEDGNVQGPGRRRGFCWSDEGIYKVLTDHMKHMADSALKTPDGERFVEIWLTETADVNCYCRDCGGENGYILETKGILKVYEEIRKDYPGLKLLIGLSQGTTRTGVNSRIIELAAEHGAGVNYYDGHLTYITDREPMIFSELEEYARSGGIVDVIPQVTPSFFALFPGSMARFIQFRAQEFADKRLQVVTAYSQRGQYYYPVNMAAWGEYTWNANGRSPHDFARAYATVTGIAGPEAFARWADAAGEAAWELAVSHYMHNSGFGRTTWLPDIIEEDWFQETNSIRIGRALERAREAVRLAREAGGGVMLAESEAALAAIESIRLRSQIAGLLRTPEGREKASEKLDKLDICAQLVRASIYRWHRAALETAEGLSESTPEFIRPPSTLEEWSPVTPGGQLYHIWGMAPYPHIRHRHELQAHVILRASDIERQTASVFGVPDTRGGRAPVEIIEWTPGDFEGGTAEFSVDISGMVPLSGGNYNLGMNLIEGPNCRPSTAGLVTVNERTGERNVARFDELMRTYRSLSTARPFNAVFDHLLKVPARQRGEKLMLEIRLDSGGAGSSGYMTLRRVWERDEFPEKKIDLLMGGIENTGMISGGDGCKAL